MVLFVAMTSYLFFFVTSFGVNSEASLRDLFDILPWILALFAPASTMRLLSEEQRDGTLELLLTQPIRVWIVLLSKFVSGVIFVSVAILATVGIAIGLATAGDLDVGAVIAQYIGSLFLTASFIAIGLFASSLTRNQIVSFILGIFIIAVLMLMGLDIVVDSLPNRVSGLLQTLGPVTHFETIARGVIELRDVLYFVALISTFLSATFLTIRGKSLSHKSVQYRNLQLGVAGLIVFSLLIGWFGSAIGGRWDLTDDKLFTLSPATEAILSELDDLLTVKIFQTKDPPVEISLATRDVNDFMEDFAASSGGMVKIVRKYPDGEGDEEELEDAREAQLTGIPVRQFNVRGQSEIGVKLGYLGVAMTYIDRREVIPFIGSVQGFEYRIASLTNRMIKEERKNVVFLTGHGQKDRATEMQALSGQLAQQYNVMEVDGSGDLVLDLSTVDVLMIIGPTQEISVNVRQSIADYLGNGGKAMILIDTTIIDPERLAAVPNRDSFADFVGQFGVIVESDVIFDVQSNEALSFSNQVGSSVLLPYPYWARVRTIDAKVAGDVETVVLPWASSIGISESQVGEVEFIPLMQTTEFGAIDFTYQDLRPNSAIFDQLEPQNFVQSLVGVAVQQAGLSDEDEAFRLVVVGDSDWVTDPLIARADENLALALNLVDWLAQEDALASIRSKVITNRQLLFGSALHLNLVQYANIAGVPLLFIILGTFRFLRRRSIGLRTYSREK